MRKIRVSDVKIQNCGRHKNVGINCKTKYVSRCVYIYKFVANLCDNALSREHAISCDLSGWTMMFVI